MEIETIESEPAAEAVLKQAERIEQATASEVSTIPAALLAREAAVRVLRDVEVAVAVGETKNGLDKARADVTARRSALDQIASRLRGFRARLAALAPELVKANADLKAELPAHIESIKAGFAAEWAEAVKAFAVTLSRRKAIEELLGELALPEPAPEVCDLGEAARPHRILEALAAGLTRITRLQGSRGATYAPVPGQAIVHYDPDRAYVLKRPAGGLDAGTVVADCSFPEGKLERLVQTGWTVPWRDPEEQRGIRDAQRALKKLDQDAKAEAEQQERARRKEQATDRNEHLRQFETEHERAERDAWERKDREVSQRPPQPAVSDVGREEIEALIDGSRV